MRLTGVIAAVAVAAALLAGCAPTTPEPRPLTTEEAELLAVIRFNNFDAGTRSIDMTVPGDDGVRIEGWADFATHIGYGAASDGANEDPLGLVRWTLGSVGVREGALPDDLLPPPTDGWVVGALDASSTINTALAVVLSLGSDRPDNPQLLQQTDARWLRTDEVEGTPVTVFAGPSADEVATAEPVKGAELTRYWVDDDGVLLRFEARNDPAVDEWVVVDFGEAYDVDLGVVPDVDADQ